MRPAKRPGLALNVFVTGRPTFQSNHLHYPNRLRVLDLGVSLSIRLGKMSDN